MMKNKEIEEDSSEWIKKCLRSHIKMFESILDGLEDKDAECRQDAQYFAFIIFQHIRAALDSFKDKEGESVH